MKNRGGLMAPENFDIIKEERRRNMQKSKFSYIENECGIKIIGTFETFSPTFPTPEIASILRISPRDPILKIQTQAVDSNSIPLDYSLLYSNIFEFQVKYFFPR